MAEATPIPRTVAATDWPTWQPTDVATLVFVVHDGRILLIRKKRGLGAGKINGPGGRLEPGESIEECAVRELREELCITPQELWFGGDHRFQFVDGYSIHVHVFRANGWEGEPGFDIPEPIEFNSALAALLPGAELLVSAVPTAYLRDVWTGFKTSFYTPEELWELAAELQDLDGGSNSA